MLFTEKSVLAINGGSSSIKFAAYKPGEWANPFLSGQIAHITTANATLSFNIPGSKEERLDIKVSSLAEAGSYLLQWLDEQHIFKSLAAVGHRVVHGMHHTQPELITDDLIKELKTISAYDPDHLPDEIKLIEAFRKKLPGIPQVACFDTSFHTNMPPVAKLLPIPRNYFEKGIQRYGFHGLSYAYLMDELEQVAGTKSAHGKVILAHLGSGASLAAVEHSKCADTSMGFTPASGITMSTRTGDLDPGVAWYLMQSEKLNAGQFSNLINHKSGLLGISESSDDMKTLLQLEATDSRAAEAIELFCYQAKKCIGSFAAVLGGLDTLVFSGGIGQHSAIIRQRICNSLGFLGIELNQAANHNNEAIISTGTSKVCVRVICTNEELMIAKLVTHLLNQTPLIK